MTRTGFAAAIALALLAAPACAKPKPFDSWGRAGVDFETYRQDAVECALTAHYADVSQTSQAKALVTATRQIEALDSANYSPPDATSEQALYLLVGQANAYERVRQGARAEKKIEELKERLTGVLEECLVERGYSQFRLTDGQREQLSGMKKGTDERHRFLHDLASDPEILEQQAIGAAAG